MSPTPLTNLALQERTRREIMHKSDLIKPLPDVVVRILGMLNDGDSEPAAIEKHLQVDQVLVAKMLGMVNSPFYGLSRQVRSVREAIMVLGFRGLRSLLLASTTAKYMNRDFKCYGHDQNGLLKHAFCVASASRSLAGCTDQGGDVCEEVFIAGLLHDIGKMLLAPYLEQQKVTPEQIRAGVIRAELDALGLDHTDCGALVAAKWNLSMNVQEILKHHHDVTQDDALPVEVSIVRLADALVHERGTGYLPAFVQEPVYLANDFVRLGLSKDSWIEAQKAMDEAMTAALGTMHMIAS